MPILEADELAELREDLAETLEEVFPDVGVLYRPGTATRNTSHPSIRTNAAQAVLEDIPCSYRGSSPREIQVSGRPQNEISFTISLPATFEVKEKDIFVVAAKGEEPELKFHITAPLLRSNAIKRQVTATLES